MDKSGPFYLNGLDSNLYCGPNILKNTLISDKKKSSFNNLLDMHKGACQKVIDTAKVQTKV